MKQNNGHGIACGIQVNWKYYTKIVWYKHNTFTWGFWTLPLVYLQYIKYVQRLAKVLNWAWRQQVFLDFCLLNGIHWKGYSTFLEIGSFYNSPRV